MASKKPRTPIECDHHGSRTRVDIDKRHPEGYYLSLTFTMVPNGQGDWYYSVPMSRAQLAELARMIDELPDETEGA